MSTISGANGERLRISLSEVHYLADKTQDSRETEGYNGAWMPGTQGPDRVSPQECIRNARDALNRAYACSIAPWPMIAEAVDWQRLVVEQMLPQDQP